VIRTTHLKLMIDYNLVDPEILAALEKLNALKVKTILDCGFSQHTGDDTLVNKGTVEHERVLLTRDKRTITKKKYKPCKHGGVIVIKHPRPTADMVFAWMKAFVQSGKRALAKNHFTYLRADGATIYTLSREPVEVRF
jgi:hypothetical protein